MRAGRFRCDLLRTVPCSETRNRGCCGARQLHRLRIAGRRLPIHGQPGRLHRERLNCGRRELRRQRGHSTAGRAESRHGHSSRIHSRRWRYVVILIGITDNHGIFGIFIAAWIAYQVFDAHQTAKARRDGLPLPDPFGLNELGTKLGISNSPVTPPFTQTYTTTAVPPVPPAAPAAGFNDPYQSYSQPYNQPYNTPYTNVPPAPGSMPPFAGSVPPAGMPPYGAPPPGNIPPYGAVPPFGAMPPDGDPSMPLRHREPVGAIVLIGLGLLFLFNTLGFFRFNWIGHFWPIFVIGLGAWLLIRRTGADVRFSARMGKTHDNPPPPPPAGGGL